MRRAIVIIMLAVAVIATTVPSVDAQYTFSSTKQQKSRRRGSKRSADSGNSDPSTERGIPASSSSMNAAQQGTKGGYSFSDLGNANSGKGSQKQPSSTATSTSTASATTASTTVTASASAKQSAVVKADNVTSKAPLGESQAAALPLTPETPAYSKETDPKQTDVGVPSPSPTTPAKKSLGESQVAGRPVVLAPTPAPPADDGEDEDDEQEENEEEEDNETEEEPQDPGADDTNSPKQSYT